MATDTKLQTPGFERHEKYDDFDYPTIVPEKQSGHPGHTTKEQDAQVFMLRSQLEQAGYTERLDTLSMLRFLRARKFNVEAAKKMFIDCETWRKEFGVDDLLQNFDYHEKAQIFEYYPQYYHKIDKDGRPVYIEHLGKIDLNKMMKITTDKRMIQNLVCEYEKLADPRLPACSRHSQRLHETCCSILDLKGVGVTSVPSVYGYVKQTSAISQNYYPERLGQMYLVNAPWGFAGAFNLVKGWLDPVTVAKIHILGSGYQSELHKQIPKENLPASLGGTCHCDKSCMLSDAGPWQNPEFAKPPKWAKPGAAAGSPAAAETKTDARPAATTTSAPAPAPQHGLSGASEAQAPLGGGAPAPA